MSKGGGGCHQCAHAESREPTKRLSYIVVAMTTKTHLVEKDVTVQSLVTLVLHKLEVQHICLLLSRHDGCPENGVVLTVFHP